MKKILTFGILCILFGCSSIPKETVIPYILSIEAEQSIYKTIQMDKTKTALFFVERIEMKKFKFHLLDSDNNVASNRKLFVNDRFYPLIFDTDYTFFVKMEGNYPIVSKFENVDEKKSHIVKMPEISERVKNKSLYLKDFKLPLMENTIYWIVDEKGNLLETNAKQ